MLDPTTPAQIHGPLVTLFAPPELPSSIHTDDGLYSADADGHIRMPAHAIVPALLAQGYVIVPDKAG